MKDPGLSFDGIRNYRFVIREGFNRRHNYYNSFFVAMLLNTIQLEASK